jgi:hypothetical protein
MKAALTLSLCLAASLAAAASKPLCKLQDRQINESSGLAPAADSDRYFFTHNDSGDKARFFAVGTDGRTLLTVTVPGAKAVDWEDMAGRAAPNGKRYLYLGDIGDNNRVRSSVQVYRVAQPEVDPEQRGRLGTATGVVRYELKYEGGAQNAESLLVSPEGRLYVVTKSGSGSGVYAAPAPLRAEGVNLMRKIASISFLALPATTRTLQDHVRKLLATGGAISPDGKRVVVCTYTDAYEWKIEGDLAAAFRTKPRHIPLPGMKQAEAICYTQDSKAMLAGSEGVGAPVYRLPLP